MWKTILPAAIAVALGVTVGSAARAAPLTIQNPSFELPLADPTFGLTINGTPITGWVSTNNFETGQWDIGAFPYGCWTVPAPDGNQVAYAAYLLTNQGISQVLSDTVQPNTVYTLTGYAGSVRDPNNPAGPSQYAVPQTISLLAVGGAGDQVLTASTFTPVTGQFEQFTLTFDSTGSAAVGLPLKISLIASADQVAWDNIKLDASPVPEPTSMLLLLVGGAALIWKRSKQG